MDPLFTSRLDPGAARLRVAAALDGADDGELYLEHRLTEALVFDDGRLKTASFDTAHGFGLRAVRGETTGFAHSTDVSEAGLARATATVRLALKGGGGTAADAPRGTNARLYDGENPLAAHGFDARVELLAAIDAAARAADPRVVQASVTLAGQWSFVQILRADGRLVTDRRPLVRLGVSVVLEENGRRESGSFGLGGRHGYAPLLLPQTWGRALERALEEARINLASVPAPAGEMPVLLGPGWPGILLHEAVGHGLEGDFARRGTSAFAGRVGERVAAPGVTVVDDATLPGRRGSIATDDEGTPGQRTVLIEDGVLLGYLQDRQNARLMGVAPTGNGRRESHAHPPMPRMTNTFLAAGHDEPQALLGSMKRGLWAKSFGGGQVDITSGRFVFACTEAWRVENGRAVEPVKGAMLVGHGPSVMLRIRGLGHDLALDEGIGTCGKAGQSVPAGVGQPTVLADGLTVGGTG